MAHEANRNRVTAPPPEALTDAQQKKKPWAKPTVLALDDWTVHSVLAANDPTTTETGNDAYRPDS